MSIIKNISIKYESFSLRIEKLEVIDEKINAIIGPSGCGKSSFLKLLTGEIICDDLMWLKKGTDLMRLPVSQRRFGLVYQDLILFPHLTVEQNIFFSLKARKLFNKEKRQQVTETLKVFELFELRKNKTELLSGGEQQRVAILRALLSGPHILLLDEPFSSLDKTLREKIRKYVYNFSLHNKITVIIITHDIEDYKDQVDQIIDFSKFKV